MFGWFRRRQRREIAKLLYQNDAALTYLQGYFSADRDVHTWVRSALEKNRKLAVATSGGQELLNGDQLEWLLQINKEARRLYDATVGAIVGSVDSVHSPPEGWSAYLKNAVESE